MITMPKKFFVILLLLLMASSANAVIIQPEAMFYIQSRNLTFNYTWAQEGDLSCNSERCQFTNLTTFDKNSLTVGQGGDIDVDNESNVALTNYSTDLIKFMARGPANFLVEGMRSSTTFEVQRNNILYDVAYSGADGELQFELGNGWYKYSVEANSSLRDPVIVNTSAVPSTIVADNGRSTIGTNSLLKVKAVSRCGIQSVKVNLSPLGGKEMEMDRDGDDWFFLSAGGGKKSNVSYKFPVKVIDNNGSTKTSFVELLVLKRGDVYRDDVVDMKDSTYIAKYLAGKEYELSVEVGDVIGPDGKPDGKVDIRDAYYIARYNAGLEVEP